MQAVFPGRPQAQRHALDYAYHDDQLIVAYLSGTSLVLLNGHGRVIQTIEEFDALPSGLSVLRLHPQTIRIAASSSSEAYVYSLHEEVKGTLQWVKELCIHVADEDGQIKTISWGSDDELLIGTTEKLVLYNISPPSQPSSPALSSQIDHSQNPTWSRALPSRLATAAFSPSASLIATLSEYDCLVKIWRRLSFESPQFDYAYLRHPSTVTHVEWRRSQKEEEDSHTQDEDVLFTICADGVFRVWKSVNPHGIEILSLYAEIDMMVAIQPRDPSQITGGQTRYAFVLTSSMAEKLTADAGPESDSNTASQERHAQEHLSEVVSRKPDILFIADEHGHMSAWGLESVGCKRRSSASQLQANPFHINSVEHVNLGFQEGMRPDHANTLLCAICRPSAPGQVALLAHHFDGRIVWHQAPLKDLLDPSARKDRLQRLATWTGHSTAIKKVVRAASGKALISRTEDDEGIVWRQGRDGSLKRQSIVSLHEHILRVALLKDGDYLACLHHDKITLWDARGFYAVEIGRCDYSSASGKPLCLLFLPDIEPDAGVVHLATVRSDMSGVAWELLLPQYDDRDSEPKTSNSSIREFSRFHLERIDDAMYFLPVDPAGSAALASDFLDIFAHDVAVSYSPSGLLRTYTARVNRSEAKVDFLTTSTVETGLQNPALGSATSIRRAALVDSSKTRLTIWDTRNARLDHDESFTTGVQDLDWASTPDGQSILAVGFQHGVSIYSQLRYDYVNDRPAWARIKNVQVPTSNPHPIGDSVWLSDGTLVVGAGNQLYVAANTADLQKDLAPDLQTYIPHRRSTNLYQLVSRMNGALPVFHPQFISQCILAGKLDIIHRVLIVLLDTLKFYTEGDDLDPMLGFEIGDFISQNGTSDSLATSDQRQVGTSGSVVTKEVAETLNELLTQKSVPQLTSPEQFSLVSIIECIATVAVHSRSIDTNASRFLLFWRSTLLRSRQQRINGSVRPPPPSIAWREIIFAYHSSSQDILTSLILSHAPSQQLTWPLAKQSRIFTWLTSRTTLLEQFEAIARTAYTTSDPKDPVDCSLYYLALRKKPILVNLWRMATWHKEQSLTMRMLRNDFTETRWKTAAKKNAFALMGKRRFEYAAAFFLLADDLRSALGVIANQMEDVQLAIAVGRVYGGDDCAEVQDLVRSNILTAAVEQGDRWMATWAFWYLGDRGRAVRSLITPLEQIWPTEKGEDQSKSHRAEEESRTLRAKSFLNDDPALVILYEQLRAKSLQTLRGALMIDGREEWMFVVRTAGLLRRMGCDILALDLVRNWEFLRMEQGRRGEAEGDDAEAVAELPPSPSATRDVDPRKLLRCRSSLVVDDLGEAREAAGVPSMLDGFGGPETVVKPRAEAPKVKSMLDDFGMDDGGPVKKQEAEVPSMLDGFEGGRPSPRVQKSAEKQEEERAGKTKKGEEKKATSFKEPDANSLLDSFGF